MYSHLPPPHMYGHHDENELELAHFNKPELHALDQIQGGPERVNGLRIYSKLGTSLEHPDTVHNMHAHFRDHMASGGHLMHEHVKQLARNGRFGDTEIAAVPRHVLRHFDHAIGGPVYNPRDGKKEYFLGALIGSLARFAAPAARAIGSIFTRTPSAASSASRIGTMFPKPGIGAASGYAPSSQAVNSFASQLPRMGASV